MLDTYLKVGVFLFYYYGFGQTISAVTCFTVISNAEVRVIAIISYNLQATWGISY